ncbi:MAG: glycosyltransferase family 2 protein [Chromatiales bacterium]|nr:glycosyltransferase family 2 protein [Chromatiales bacterium]
MKIEIIISTYGERLRNVERQLLEKAPWLCYLIVHQAGPESGGHGALPRFIAERDDVRYLGCRSKGLPLSRNTGVSMAVGDILLPTDDDVTFFAEGLLRLRECFEADRRADIITFRAATDSGGFQKHYASESFVHGRRSLLSVTSIEVAIRRSALEGLDLRWDEDFGLGARYGGGLENVFLSDAFRKGARAIYQPVTIVSHAVEHSGRNLDYGSAFVKGAMFGRIFGFSAPLFCAAFVVRKAMRRELRIGAGRYFLGMLRGLWDFAGIFRRRRPV